MISIAFFCQVCKVVLKMEMTHLILLTFIINFFNFILENNLFLKNQTSFYLSLYYILVRTKKGGLRLLYIMKTLVSNHPSSTYFFYKKKNIQNSF